MLKLSKFQPDRFSRNRASYEPVHEILDIIKQSLVITQSINQRPHYQSVKLSA